MRAGSHGPALIASRASAICDASGRDDAALLEEQLEYYRQRAPEYDITSRPPDDALAPYGAKLRAALEHFAPRGDVLEIASGTGGWTRDLLRHASHVTALDAAPEMHRIARRKLGANEARIRFVTADVFAWEPDRGYDVVFFANWLSHVPPSKFAGFWNLVRRALRRGGRVFVVDERVDAWRHEALRAERDVEGSVPVVERKLLDGRAFRVVKVFWDERALARALHDLGWSMHVHGVGPFFWAAGGRVAD